MTSTSSACLVLTLDEVVVWRFVFEVVFNFRPSPSLRMSSLHALRIAKKTRLHEKLAAARAVKATSSKEPLEIAEDVFENKSVSTDSDDVFDDTRQIVEFRTMRNRILKGCSECSDPLDFFKSCTSEAQRVGFAFEHQVVCPKCGHSNTIPSGKAHSCKRRRSEGDTTDAPDEPCSKRTHSHAGGKIYDMNTKAAVIVVEFFQLVSLENF